MQEEREEQGLYRGRHGHICCFSAQEFNKGIQKLLATRIAVYLMTFLIVTVAWAAHTRSDLSGCECVPGPLWPSLCGLMHRGEATYLPAPQNLSLKCSQAPGTSLYNSPGAWLLAGWHWSSCWEGADACVLASSCQVVPASWEN